MKGTYINVSLRSSPHLWRGESVQDVMFDVVLALLPIVALSFYIFGLSAILLIIITSLSCLITEFLYCKLIKKFSTIKDYSALITGLTLALSLPPAFPLWMAALGGCVAILLGKLIFGGLGFNPFNPALVGRAFLQAAFPVAITTWTTPFTGGRFINIEPTTLTLPFTNIVPFEKTQSIIGATPLASFKFGEALKEALPISLNSFLNQLSELHDLFIGNIAGSTGETSAILIILGGIFLIYKKIIDWRIPIGILLSVIILSFILSYLTPRCPNPMFMILSGGLLFGAVFMATDLVTSPVTKLGTWLYAILIGILVVVIRVWGSLPEGVMYAILLGNAVTPLLDRLTQSRAYGEKK